MPCESDMQRKSNQMYRPNAPPPQNSAPFVTNKKKAKDIYNQVSFWWRKKMAANGHGLLLSSLSPNAKPRAADQMRLFSGMMTCHGPMTSTSP
jgi:hypothetical protein